MFHVLPLEIRGRRKTYKNITTKAFTTKTRPLKWTEHACVTGLSRVAVSAAATARQKNIEDSMDKRTGYYRRMGMCVSECDGEPIASA